MIQRVYIDTSVVGGYFDKEFLVDTIPFFESVKKGEIRILVSDLLFAELSRAPEYIKQFLELIDESHIERLSLTSEAMELAD